MTQRRSISGALREAIKESGLTCYAISKRSGVAESALSRFMSGERSLSLDTVERLADVLGAELVVRNDLRR